MLPPQAARATPLALAAWSVRAAGPGGLRLTADDVEQAYHEHGINTFLFHFLMRPMVLRSALNGRGMRAAEAGGLRGLSTVPIAVGKPGA